jgi:uncharacterized protein (TIGR02646 family)
MQYIPKKEIQPLDWDTWFTKGTGTRSYDYKSDFSALRSIVNAKKYLLDEQYGLCAYCQNTLILEKASIEHVIPKEHNVPYSTNYHNLVAVCKNTNSDENGKKFCEPIRGSEILPTIIFYSDAQVTKDKNHAYIKSNRDGTITPKPNCLDCKKNQVGAFIEILNLNHSSLVKNRKNALDGILEYWNMLSDNRQKQNYLQIQFDRVLSTLNTPYRQFLLIYLGQKLGKN